MVRWYAPLRTKSQMISSLRIDYVRSGAPNLLTPCVRLLPLCIPTVAFLKMLVFKTDDNFIVGEEKAIASNLDLEDV